MSCLSKGCQVEHITPAANAPYFIGLNLSHGCDSAILSEGNDALMSRTPLVLGTSWSRGSGLTAWRRALAVALKIASAMWWLLVP